jgi:hypothetical protein
MFGAMIASSVLRHRPDRGRPATLDARRRAGRHRRRDRHALFADQDVDAVSRRAGLGSFAVAIIISAIFVAVILLTTNVRFADVVVAFAGR